MSTLIGLIGYGKMGKMIASLAQQRDCKVASIIDPADDGLYHEINRESLHDCEVCIDFSHPTVVMDNLRKVINLGMDIVVGTTGWIEQLPEIEQLVNRAGTGLLYGANFSIGMNLFSRVVSEAVKYFDRFDAYDVYGWEQHHNQKADSPSGTAIELAKLIIANSSRKDTALYDTSKHRIKPNELHFTSLRAGSIPGTHTVGWDSEADSIELTHRVRSRSGFAYGALEAAKWIKGRKGIHSFSEMIAGMLC